MRTSATCAPAGMVARTGTRLGEAAPIICCPGEPQHQSSPVSTAQAYLRVASTWLARNTLASVVASHVSWPSSERALAWNVPGGPIHWLLPRIPIPGKVQVKRTLPSLSLVTSAGSIVPSPEIVIRMPEIGRDS